MSDSNVAKIEESPLDGGSSSGRRIVQMIRRYEELQRCLDQALPDCMVTIATTKGSPAFRTKKFRTKKYWNAVALAFKIDVSLVSEERIKHEAGGKMHWGYAVVYRASINTTNQTGDGACTSDELLSPTLHTVRSRAHTRARNRAISNLVAFGEVTAEELTSDH